MTSFSKLKELYPDNWQFIASQYKKKQNYTCELCGIQYKRNHQFLHVHHKIPLSKGGTSDDFNLQCLCYKCHRKQHSHMQRSNNNSRMKFSKPFS